MLAKLIRCNVLPQQRPAFSQAQQMWAETAKCDGFITQFGGWKQNDDEAVIIALWQDRGSLDCFMAKTHDEIYAKSGQKETYLQCRIGFYNQLFEIPLNSQTKQPGLLRIADCEVLPGREAHFIEVQKSIWNPGMASVNGMLGGHFWQSPTQPNRFMVATLWQDQNCHQNYLKHHFPDLKSKARIEDDIAAIDGLLVDLDNRWLLLPSA